MIMFGSIAAHANACAIAMYEAGLSRASSSARYVPVVAPTLREALAATETLSLRGFTVSMPFKHSILEHGEANDADVVAIGAANTVLRTSKGLTCHNTDWIGADRALAEVSDFAGARVLIVGAGGAARAVAYALRKKQCSVYISARSDAKSRQLVDDLSLVDLCPLRAQGTLRVDLVVNATPLNYSAADAVHLGQYERAKYLFDLSFATLASPLVTAARALGWRTVPGWRMLLHQATEQVRLFTNAPAPVLAMEAALTASLPSHECPDLG